MKNKILVFGKSQEIMNKVLTLMKDENLMGVGFLEIEEIKLALVENQPTLLVIGGGVGDLERASLKSFIQEKNVEVKIYEHYGGAYGFIEGIKKTLENKK